MEIYITVKTNKLLNLKVLRKRARINLCRYFGVYTLHHSKIIISSHEIRTKDTLEKWKNRIKKSYRNNCYIDLFYYSIYQTSHFDVALLKITLIYS